MGRFVDTAQAASLAGVSRVDIKQQIKDGSLSMVRGRILFDDLVELYPHVEFMDKDMHSKVSRIKEEAIVKESVQELQSNDPEVLRTELEKKLSEIAYYRNRIREYKVVLADTRHMLEELQHKVGEKQRVEGIIRWLDNKLKPK